MPTTRTLVLASSSPYRRALLERLGLDFEWAASNVDESRLNDEMPGALALRLAESKARAVASHYPGAVVIGSDQVAHLDGEFLGKPENEAGARRQLVLASGREVEFITGVAVVDVANGAVRRHFDRTVVTFRELSDDEITRYVERDKPYDCAGGFRSEGLGITLFERVATDDPTALVGLPLIATARLLRESGVIIF